jgi:hypothetical protein
MGFERQVYKLRWPENSRWHGLEVRLKGLAMGELKTISELRGGNGEEANDLGRAEPVLEILGSALLSWNLEEDGVPVPIEDFRGEDLIMLMAIVSAWTDMAGDVPAPLPKASSDGEKSEEALIPMEIPSASHLNLNLPN